MATYKQFTNWNAVTILISIPFCMTHKSQCLNRNLSVYQQHIWHAHQIYWRQAPTATGYLMLKSKPGGGHINVTRMFINLNTIFRIDWASNLVPLTLVSEELNSLLHVIHFKRMRQEIKMMRITSLFFLFTWRRLKWLEALENKNTCHA